MTQNNSNSLCLCIFDLTKKYALIKTEPTHLLFFSNNKMPITQTEANTSVTFRRRHNNPYSATCPVTFSYHTADRSSGVIIKDVPSPSDDADSHSDKSIDDSHTIAPIRNSLYDCYSMWFPRPSASTIGQHAFNAQKDYFKRYATHVTADFARQRPTACGGKQVPLTEQQLNCRGKGIVNPRHMRELHSFAVELGAGVHVRYPTKKFCFEMRQQQWQMFSGFCMNGKDIVTLHIGGVPTSATDEQMGSLVYIITGVLPVTLERCPNHSNDLANSFMLRVAWRHASCEPRHPVH